MGVRVVEAARSTPSHGVLDTFTYT